MNLRTALSLETMQLDVQTVADALLPPPTPAQTGLVIGGANAVQDINTVTAVNDAITTADEKAEVVLDIHDAAEVASDVIAAVESLRVMNLDRKALTVAIESVLASHQLDEIFDKHFQGNVSLESITLMSDAEFQTSMEGVIKDIVTGQHNLMNRGGKAFADWWAYSATALETLSGDATVLLGTVRGMRGMQSKQATFRAGALQTLQCNGKADAKSIMTGFKALMETEERLNSKMPGYFKDYYKALLKAYRDTASTTDSVAEGVRSFLRFFMWVNLFGGIMTGSAFAINRAWGNWAWGEVIPNVVDHLRRNGSGDRALAVDDAMKSVGQAFDTLLKDVSDSNKAKPLSGDRSLLIIRSLEDANSRMLTKANFSIVTDEKVQLGESADVPTPTLAELETLLSLVIDGSKEFKHRKEISGQLEKMASDEMAIFRKDRVSGQERSALDTLERYFGKTNQYLYAMPMIALGKMHVSTSRSILAYCRAAIATYA